MFPEARTRADMYSIELITPKAASVGAQSLEMQDGSEMDAWGTGPSIVKTDYGAHPCKSKATGNEMTKIILQLDQLSISTTLGLQGSWASEASEN